MRKAAAGLKGTHDFKSFQSASQRSRIKNTVRTVKHLTIIKNKDLIHISISADGFLYKMVRNIAGTLLAIGSGQLLEDDMPKILKAKNRKLAWDTAPAEGLCLIAVKY